MSGRRPLASTAARVLRLFAILAILMTLAPALLPAPALAADGSLDTTFDPGTGANNNVRALVVQGDGKVVIGGNFTEVNGVARNSIARLNADGTLDTTFDPGSGANGDVQTLALQGDGKLLIGGSFTEVSGVARNFIARLKADGTLDTAFDPGSGASGSVQTLALQGDGKLLIGGFFSYVNGVARNSIARLNADGTLDTTFDPGTGPSGLMQTLAVQGDGKVVIGGFFSYVNGVGRNSIARLNADGSLDTTFDPGSGANGSVQTLALQGDGKVLIGGSFTTMSGVARNNIARINADGTLDTTFDPGSGTNSSVWTLALQGDGKVVIGGGFTQMNGVGRARIARLNADGSLDTAFNSGGGVTSTVMSVAVQGDGKVVIGGFFSYVNGVARNSIARLNGPPPAPGFDLGGVADNTVRALAVQGDGKLLIGGIFGEVNGVGRNSIARLNADGSLDTTFDPGSGANGDVQTLALQGDGKVVIAGAFTEVNGAGRNSIARLNADGSLDTTFNPGSGANGDVQTLALQGDGKLLIGGAFTEVDGVARNNIARLNANGTLDTSFNPGMGSNSIIVALTVQGDGKVLIGGAFTEVSGVGRNSIARLNADGSLDTTFDPGSGANGDVQTLALQGDGKVVIGGSFSYVDGVARNNIARLNADGSLDTTFDPGSGANGDVQTLALQGDGKVLLGGSFTEVSGVARNNIARLNADVTLDTAFDPSSGANNTVQALALQGNGKVVIGGNFTAVNGLPLLRVARLNADGSPDVKRPLIAVSFVGPAITPGDTTPSWGLGTDFGTTPFTEPVERTFTIRNSGDAALTLSGATPVTLAGAGASAFSVSAQPASPVAANGGSTTFTVRFAPATAGTFDATVSIASNDSARSPYTFAIAGVATKIAQALSFAQPADTTYGAGAVALSATATSNLPAAFTSSTPAVCTVTGSSVTIVGAGTCTVAANQAGDERYLAAPELSRSFAVARAALTVTARDASRRVGAANPPFEALYSGFVNGETAAALDTPVTLTTTATSSSPAGSYPIVASGAADANYSITFVNGTLTVEAAPSTRPTLTLTGGAEGRPGSFFSFAAAGFAPNAAVTVAVDGREVLRASADAGGRMSFVLFFNSVARAGTYTVAVSGEAAAPSLTAVQTATTTVTISPTAPLLPRPADPALPTTSALPTVFLPIVVR